MFYNFIFSIVTFIVFFSCYAEVEYQILPLNSSEEFNSINNNPKGPNALGQMIDFIPLKLDFTKEFEFGKKYPPNWFTNESAYGWFYDPTIGKIPFPRGYEPFFISDSGHVVGGSYWSTYLKHLENGTLYHDNLAGRSTFTNRGFIWNLENGLQEFDLPSSRGFIKAINNNGDVLLNAAPSNGKTTFAYIFTANKEMIKLGEFPSSGRAINDVSQVVGLTSFPEKKQFIAFIWDERKGMQDLISLIPAESEWSELLSADSIDNQGVITGNGIYRGKESKFLLIPISLL